MANSQDASPKPSNSGERTATGMRPDSANSSGQPAPGNTIGPLSPAQPATPANAPAGVLNSPLVTSSPESGAAVPQSALFEFLFNNISILNQVADSDDKAGNHQSAAMWRTHDQRAAGLNDAEGQILQEVALDCLRALKEQDAKIRAFVEKDRAQATPGVIGPTPIELIKMVDDRKNIVSEHIERLREALGDSSFKKLDAYVHSSFHAEVIAPKPTPAPTSGETQKENK